MFSKLKALEYKVSTKIMFGLGLLGSAISAQCPVIAHASEESGDHASGSLDWLTDTNDDTLNDLTNKVKGVGSSIYQLMLVFGIIGLLCSIVWAGIQLSTNKSAAKKEENKSHLLWIAIGGIIIFGAMSILGLLQTIGTGLEF